MPQPGGSATMYGVLYQLLATAHWATQIYLNVKSKDNDWTDTLLIIEPSGGGGDLLVESPRRLIVEQWKAKGNAGAWSLRKVIEDVLPDLYRAADLADVNRQVEFRFVTEGHRGRWDAAERFFAELRGNQIPEDPFALLVDVKYFITFSGKDFTKRGFFQCIFKSLRTHSDIELDSEIVSAKKLWFVLGQFVIRGEQSAEKLVRELDGFLKPLVDYKEEVESKRRELCAALLELASEGNATFSAHDLLAKVNLEKGPFSDWARAREAILTQASRALQNRWRYRQDLDVRSPTVLRTNRFVCVLNGESGQGKTWCLASLALDVLARGSLAVAITATGDAEKDLQNAANIIWRGGFGRESPTDIELIVRKRREFLPHLQNPWLTIYIDDVPTTAEARSLIDRDWASMGVRLAITSLPSVTQALKTQFGEMIEVIDACNFSIVELRRYLETAGYDWGMIRDDVRTILRRPLLAKIYCDLVEHENWRDADEYLLFARFWQRILDDRNQADYPGDIEALRRLAFTFLHQGVVYPWTQAECRKHGLSSDALIRLESIGWLRRVEGDRVEVTHDRLLNWAVAETLVAMRVGNEGSSGQFVKFVAQYFGRESVSISGRMLGYVPMDVCWLLSDPDRGLLHELPKMIEALEDKNSIWHSEPLYRSVLPTIGPRVIQPMIDRVRLAHDASKETNELDALVRFLSQAVMQIGVQHPDDVIEWGNRMLHDTCESIRKASLHVLKRYPNASALDKLWDIHRVNYEEYLRKEGSQYWVAHDNSFAALRSCIRLHPEWLMRRIVTSEAGSEPFTELAYLVSNLHGARGRDLWMQAKK